MTLHDALTYTATVTPGVSPGVFVRSPETERIRKGYGGWSIIMTHVKSDTITLVNDTRLNVASLLLEEVGSTREIALTHTSLQLDHDLVASSVIANVNLTRLEDGLLAKGSIHGTVELECARCLNLYEQPFKTRFTEQYRQTVDVRSGSGDSHPRATTENQNEDDELNFEIDDAHELDLAEMLRQNILLILPMRPDCGEGCPGPPEIQNEPEAQIDSRFAALEQLLDDE